LSEDRAKSEMEV